MEKDFNKLVEFYYQKKQEGMDFSQIRKELIDQKISEEMIKDIMKEIDSRILAVESRKKGKLKAKELRWIGWSLMIIGGFLTFANYFHLFELKGYAFIGYGPVIVGYLFLIAARKAQRKES
ncbi:hypothetical protein [Ancylomarina longa]|uniref:DUF2335 domain-containing protein n=1 Tax=Ancylomarina longa TaxID=2487017 RepID=A0A434AUV0_9BACT|nr:hypothetical protein [Ancylomarina longa]RUT78248.1 hypothetical protein DLK05_09230 [Ancylomarina longa]